MEESTSAASTVQDTGFFVTPTVLMILFLIFLYFIIHYCVLKPREAKKLKVINDRISKTFVSPMSLRDINHEYFCIKKQDGQKTLVAYIKEHSYFGDKHELREDEKDLEWKEIEIFDWVKDAQVRNLRPETIFATELAAEGLFSIRIVKLPDDEEESPVLVEEPAQLIPK